MPAKNVIKIYVSGGFYHVYNRGVDKNNIFLEEKDYRYFLYLLKIYLLPKEETINLATNEEEKISLLRLNNFYQKIELLTFCLMSNHFHLLIRQNDEQSIKIFIKSLLVKYVSYFNKKYQRVGPLFQGVYKAVLIENEEQLYHVSRYIHLNPLDLVKDISLLKNYKWSSYLAYIKNWNVKWLKKDFILNHFNSDNYKKFVEEYQTFNKKELEIYKRLMIDL